ncbi:MAG: hypothetical protein IPG79_17700 [Saprospiraceae bacterium]|nr:hypothetical protein [Saprospiraceae bacterium]MBK8853891.1 hypothetical protein [Saprospiraceae bacterium]
MLDTKGHYEPEYADFSIIIKGLPFIPGKIWLNHNEEDFNLLQKVEQGYKISVKRKLFLHLVIQ